MLLFFFGGPWAGGVWLYPQNIDPHAVALTMIGALQILSLWFAKKKKPWSIIIMCLLSSLAIPTLLLSAGVFSGGGVTYGIAMIIVYVLNIGNIGLLCQDSITSRLLGRQPAQHNDDPVVVLVVLQTLVGSFLILLFVTFLLPRVTELASLGVCLMSVIWAVSLFLFPSITLVTVRQRYALRLFFTLDIVLLGVGLVSLAVSLQHPDLVVPRWPSYLPWTEGVYQGIAHASVWSAVVLLFVLIYSMPSMESNKGLFDSKEKRMEGIEEPKQQ